MKNKILVLTTILLCSSQLKAQVAHYDMSTEGGKVTESVSGAKYDVHSQLPVFSVESPYSQALRFDGYSNYITAGLPLSSLSTSTATISIVLAPETYPMMTAEAETTPTFGLICGNLDEDAKTGFAFELSSQGDLRFRFGSVYANGWIYTLKGNEKLPRGCWSRITAVLDKTQNLATLYLNNKAIGTTKMSRSEVQYGNADFLIGKSTETWLRDGANANTFCGLIDDIAFYYEAMNAEQVAALDKETLNVLPDFKYPASRYTEGNAALWRPQFHGMPSGGWTNESHGMTYSDGKYHVFFQKNANGPYMARLHWGHISSTNLCKWTEEPIAFGPSENYDIKGCWSGCIVTDEVITAGKPGAIYTAVDNARAVIAQATPLDNSLISWSKTSPSAQSAILINGRPEGLSDDFRDPFLFSAGGKKYIIVGTSKNGVGACTLHRYSDGAWSNDGTIFFKGTNANQHGTFWEMPNVTDMGNGKYLFTCTPLGLGTGVKTIYWIGTIDADGKFVATSGPEDLELGGIGKEGYGLLSPTVYNKDGKTLMLGIVPDKLPTSRNIEIGWAHNFSLPREITLSSEGTLIQRPFEGLSAMRTTSSYAKSLILNGCESLSPVSGRHIELLGEFTVGSSSFGFNFLKSGMQQAKLTYNPMFNTITLDLTSLSRVVNDGVYGGIYTASLPERPQTGSRLKIQVFVDGSIADIFIADKWAFSVRIFPTDAESIEAEAFAEGDTQATLKAWTLDAENAATEIRGITSQPHNLTTSQPYNLTGVKLCAVPTSGMYINNGKKYVVRR